MSFFFFFLCWSEFFSFNVSDSFTLLQILFSAFQNLWKDFYFFFFLPSFAVYCQLSMKEIIQMCYWLDGTVKLWARNHRSPRRSQSGERTIPATGYKINLKVEPSLRSSVMMFVTANNSASVENKRWMSGFALSRAEEWLTEMVVMVAMGVRESNTAKLFATLSWPTQSTWWEMMFITNTADDFIMRTSANYLIVCN